MALPWSLEGSERVADCRIFGLHKKTYKSPSTDTRRDFFVLHGADWVNVIAVTARDEIVFVEQFRPAIGGTSLETPGGILEPGDVSPAETAKRELMEETGYGAQAFIHLHSVRPNPAILNNACHIYVALGALPQCPPMLEEGEDITVRLIPASAVPSLIGSGDIQHAIVIAAFYSFERWRAGNWKLPPPMARA